MKPEFRAEVLKAFGGIAKRLSGLEQTAFIAGLGHELAELEMRLALLRGRLEAGESGTRMGHALDEYNNDYESFLTSMLPR